MYPFIPLTINPKDFPIGRNGYPIGPRSVEIAALGGKYSLIPDIRHDKPTTKDPRWRLLFSHRQDAAFGGVIDRTNERLPTVYRGLRPTGPVRNVVIPINKRFFPWKGGQQVEPQPHLEIVDGVQTRYIPNVRTSIDTPDVDKIHGWSHMFDHEPMSIFYCGNWEGRKPQERLIQFSADRPYEDEDPILTPEQIQDIGDADPESDDQILMYEDYEAVLNETF